MKNLKRLSACFALVLALGMPALAGETPTPPCAPGDISTPPCALAQAPIPGEMGNGGTVPGQIDTPPAVNDSASLTDIAADVLQLMLAFF